jgi:serine/threonine protein kinase
MLHEPRYVSLLDLNPVAELLVPHQKPYSTAEGDVWALGCILAEMTANVRPWKFASPEGRDYSGYLVDRTTLYETLPISDAAYTFLTKDFSARPEQRPSLAAMREVLAIDTFFVSDGEAARWGWKERVEKKLLRKMGKIGMASSGSSRCSEETS